GTAGEIGWFLRCKSDIVWVRIWPSKQPRIRVSFMKKFSFTYWRDGKFYIGFLNRYPDYWTQAATKSELIENLKDILADIDSGEVPFIRKVEELVVGMAGVGSQKPEVRVSHASTETDRLLMATWRASRLVHQSQHKAIPACAPA